MILAADIGGTNARLALFERGDRKPLVVKKYRTAAWDGAPTIVREFIAAHPTVTVTAACVAVAGPVHGGRADAINLPWPVEGHQIARALDLADVALVNDLEANARGVAVLEPDELFPLSTGDPAAAGNRIVVSAGTGLGEAALLWDGARFRAVAGEGGHADFAPRSDAEIGLYRYLAADYGHVSYERVCSGSGLVNIHSFLRNAGARSSWLQTESPAPSPAAIVAEAAADPLCLSAKALDMFTSIYGARAGNVALSFMATGGVYLGGGIAPRIVDKLAAGAFMRGFTDKGRLSPLLARIPVFVILDDLTALRGAGEIATEQATPYPEVHQALSSYVEAA
jgi:glucokinase